MNFAIRLIAVLSLGAVALPALAEDDVFIRLYKARLQQSEAALGQRKAEADYRKASYERLQLLFDKDAASLEELQLAESQFKETKLGVAENTARVAEAQALLDIATERSKLGVDMPICTSLR